MLDVCVNGTPIQPEQFYLHQQSDPFPGGSRYTIGITDTVLIKAICDRYTPALPKELSRGDTTRIFNLIGLFISLKCGRGAPLLFWGNTIDHMTFDGQTLCVQGVCSPHVGAR
jgi:hypothetical protein